jgi:hypothetical protein
VSGKKRRLIGWDRDRLVMLALNNGKEVGAAKLKLQDKKYPKATTVSPDGRHICAVYGDEFILLDDSLRELGRRRIEYANAATFSADSQRIALATWNKGEVWRVDELSKLSTGKSK